MKGTILVCLRDMLVNAHGVSTTEWAEMLAAAGLGDYVILPASLDIDDQRALQLFGEAQSRHFNSHEEMADAFGHYWCVTYAPPLYGWVYNRFTNVRDFILGMDAVHTQVTQHFSNSRPPRFTYTTVGENKLLVDYHSQRGLIYIFAGLCRGLGAYFNEKMSVEVLSPTQVSIEFQAA